MLSSVTTCFTLGMYLRAASPVQPLYSRCRSYSGFSLRCPLMILPCFRAHLDVAQC